jgi:hypothetical protein
VQAAVLEDMPALGAGSRAGQQCRQEGNYQDA